MDLRELISVARGETPADLLLKNARIVNTFTGEIELLSTVTGLPEWGITIKPRKLSIYRAGF